MSKKYVTPIVTTESFELGVFGSYGGGNNSKPRRWRWRFWRWW